MARSFLDIWPPLASGLRLGDGIDHLNIVGKPMPLSAPFASVKELQRPRTMREGAWSYENWSDLRRIATSSKLHISAEASSPWAAAAADYHRRTAFSSTAITISYQAFLRIVLERVDLPPVRPEYLNEEVRDWIHEVDRLIGEGSGSALAQAERIRREFRRHYGTGYVQLIEHGGVTGITFERQYESSEQLRQAAGSFSFSISLFAKGDLKQESETLISNERLRETARGWYVGGDPKITLPITLLDLIEAAKGHENAPSSTTDFDTASAWQASLVAQPECVLARFVPYHEIPFMSCIADGAMLNELADPRAPLVFYTGVRKQPAVAVASVDIAFGGRRRVSMPIPRPVGEIRAHGAELPLFFEWPVDRGYRHASSHIAAKWRQTGATTGVPELPADAPLYVMLRSDDELPSDDLVLDLLRREGHIRTIGRVADGGRLAVHWEAPEWAIEKVIRLAVEGRLKYRLVAVIDGLYPALVFEDLLRVAEAGRRLYVKSPRPESAWEGSESSTCAARAGWQEWSQKIYKGQTIQLTAGGRISVTRNTGNEFRWGHGVTPEGTPSRAQEKALRKNLFKHLQAARKAEEWNKKYNVIANARHGALIARFRRADGGGFSSPQPVGPSSELIVPADAFLQLRVNDSDIRNNSGQFSIALTVAGEREAADWIESVLHNASAADAVIPSLVLLGLPSASGSEEPRGALGAEAVYDAFREAVFLADSRFVLGVVPDPELPAFVAAYVAWHVTRQNLDDSGGVLARLIEASSSDAEREAVSHNWSVGTSLTAGEPESAMNTLVHELSAGGLLVVENGKTAKSSGRLLGSLDILSNALDALTALALDASPEEAEEERDSSTRHWSWKKVRKNFKRTGCSAPGCSFRCDDSASALLCCALNVSDALIRSGYALPLAADVNWCTDHAEDRRVRNADGMARVCMRQNMGRIDASGWSDRPSWNGIVYFEGGPQLTNVTGHIDLYDGAKREAVHQSYPSASTVWFWRLGA